MLQKGNKILCLTSHLATGYNLLFSLDHFFLKTVGNERDIPILQRNNKIMVGHQLDFLTKVV